MKKLLALLLCFQFLFCANAMAQQSGDGDIMKSTQDDLMLIALAGAGGAIIGLSTLSFVNEPAKHLSNIWTGAAIGVIGGVIWVAYNSAQKNGEDLESSTDFNSLERVAWHHASNKTLTIPKVQFGTQFWSMSF